MFKNIILSFKEIALNLSGKSSKCSRPWPNVSFSYESQASWPPISAKRKKYLKNVSDKAWAQTFNAFNRHK